MIDLKAVFEKFEDEFLKFDRITSPEHMRPDVTAFIMLDRILEPKPNRVGGFNDMICSAEHDEIWLDVDVEELAKVATEDNIRDLVRCGVRYDKSIDSLGLYV